MFLEFSFYVIVKYNFYYHDDTDFLVSLVLGENSIFGICYVFFTSMILLGIENFGPGGINLYARPLIGLKFSLENIIIQLFMLASLYSLIIFVFQKYGVMFAHWN